MCQRTSPILHYFIDYCIQLEHYQIFLQIFLVHPTAYAQEHFDTQSNL